MECSVMDWFTDVEARMKRKNQILFSKNNALLFELDCLIKLQSHRTLILWSLDLADEAVADLEQKYPDDLRPRNAVEATRLWAMGSIKMNVAKHEILNCHAMAKELTTPEDIALCHAIGQACSVVHTTGHALGFPMYELTAIVRKHGVENSRSLVENRFLVYIEKLLYWSEHEEKNTGSWATFLRK